MRLLILKRFQLTSSPEELTLHIPMICVFPLQTVQVPVYSEQEYQMYLHDDSWTKAETDHLFDLCHRFDLRFIVIHDRYDHQQYKVSRLDRTGVGGAAGNSLQPHQLGPNGNGRRAVCSARTITKEVTSSYTGSCHSREFFSRCQICGRSDILLASPTCHVSWAYLSLLGASITDEWQKFSKHPFTHLPLFM